MNNHNTEIDRWNVDAAHSVAADLLTKLATTEEWRNALVDGYERHGSAFIAFLLAPLVTRHGAGRVLDVFGEAFLIEGRDEEDAREVLLDQNNWARARDAAHREIGFDRLLTWDEAELRDALDQRYRFIVTYDGCFVFNREALES